MTAGRIGSLFAYMDQREQGLSAEEIAAARLRSEVETQGAELDRFAATINTTLRDRLAHRTGEGERMLAEAEAIDITAHAQRAIDGHREAHEMLTEEGNAHAERLQAVTQAQAVLHERKQQLFDRLGVLRRELSQMTRMPRWLDERFLYQVSDAYGRHCARKPKDTT